MLKKGYIAANSGLQSYKRVFVLKKTRSHWIPEKLDKIWELVYQYFLTHPSERELVWHD